MKGVGRCPCYLVGFVCIRVRSRGCGGGCAWIRWRGRVGGGERVAAEIPGGKKGTGEGL